MSQNDMNLLGKVIEKSLENEQILSAFIADLDNQIRDLQQRRKKYIELKHKQAKNRMEAESQRAEILMLPFKKG